MFVHYKELWKQRIADAINALLAENGLPETAAASSVVAEIPPQSGMGDLGFPMFAYAKLLRKAPPQIAQAALEKLAAFSGGATAFPGAAKVMGPYVNVFLDRAETVRELLKESDPEEKGGFGKPDTLKGARIMLEFSSPNTNKPLHLGHLRNDILGESMSRILAACGADVRKVCIINDRGVHICKSMLAYQTYGEGKTPESERVKSDHFVGKWYVQFNQMSKEDPGAEEKAQDMLRKWEAGDEEVTALWKKMNEWAVTGMKETYKRTGVSFDAYYFESKTYLLGKDEIARGLEKGVFYKADDGAVMIDLSAEGLGEKALLRKDGTSIYITQDIGTAIFRHEDWAFDRLIYVVGSEQQRHFKTLFSILDKLGYEWAKNLCHLSYGMVNLPEGKMKSREGTVVDADDLLDSLKEMALQEIKEKEREETVGNPDEIAEKVALGALHYYLLQVSAAKDMLFNPKESLSFNGNTGPYLQYMGARISSMLRKAALKDGAAARAAARPEMLSGDAEWEVVKTLFDYNSAIAAAAEKMDSSLLAAYLYSLSKAFSRFYHDCPILNADNPDLATARLALSEAALFVLKDALNLVGIPFLDVM
ncbi:MAG: arginine--tRNA ligase [Treponema sp.]|jgi:arginyl-tRNA synthetase|nr:arginine--tRNA ligase [Treponema sp.]